MMQMFLPILVAVVIILFGGALLVWWLLGLIRQQSIRRIARTLGVPLYMIGLVALGSSIARVQMGSLPGGTPLDNGTAANISETMTVALGTLTNTLNSTGALAPAENTMLSFSTSAPVTEVNVKAGDYVHAGDGLASVDTTALDAQVRNAEISLAQAQNALDELTAPPSDIDVRLAEAAVEAAQAGLNVASDSGSSSSDIQIAQYRVEIAQNQLWQAQLSRDNNSAMTNPNVPNAYANQIQSNSSLAQRETSVEIAQANYDSTAGTVPNQSSLGSANAQLVSAQADLDRLLAGPGDAELRQAQIGVETAQLNLDAAEEALDDATIVAPFDGIVAGVNIEVGEIPSTDAITLIDISHYTTTLSIDEKDVTQLAVGQAVNLTIRSFGDQTFAGILTRIEPAPTSSSGLVTYNVVVILTGDSEQLRPGMTAVASIVLNQLDNVIVVPKRFITTDDVTGISTVKVQTEPGTYRDVEVTLGAQSDSESVITSGISVGQTLVLLASDNAGDTGNFGFFPGGGFPGNGGGFPGNGGGGFPGG